MNRKRVLRVNIAAWQKRGAASPAGSRSTITTGLIAEFQNRTPREAFLALTAVLNSETPDCLVLRRALHYLLFPGVVLRSFLMCPLRYLNGRTPLQV